MAPAPPVSDSIKGRVVVISMLLLRDLAARCPSRALFVFLDSLLPPRDNTYNAFVGSLSSKVLTTVPLTKPCQCYFPYSAE